MRKEDNNDYGFRVGTKTYKTIADIPRKLPKDLELIPLGPFHMYTGQDARADAMKSAKQVLLHQK
jgi:hypothetical protein